MIRAALGILVALAAGCGSGTPPITRTPPDAPTRDEYVASLKEFGLRASALGRDWIDAGEHALTRATPVTTPFSETGYLAPASPAAVAYRTTLRRGRRVVADVTFESAEPAQIFLDLFEIPDPEAGQPPRRVAEADPGARRLQFDVPRDADYVVRLQPELLRGGAFTIVLRTDASLVFPVQGLSLRGRGNFGAARDAGRRSHHGVDLFAPRGTPVVAGVDGTVRVDTSDLGGNVIWLRDAGVRRSLYYAHLNGWAVDDGDRVKAGQVIGFVGNTGNARTTPPHLHFGVYERGPTDPAPYLAPGDPPPSRTVGLVSVIGKWARARRDGVVLRPAIATAEPRMATLEAHTALRVLGATGSFYRVRLPSGVEGFVSTTDAVPASAPLRHFRLGAVTTLRESPVAVAPRMGHLAARTTVDVLGEFGDFLLVRLGDAREGWIAAAPAPGAD